MKRLFGSLSGTGDGAFVIDHDFRIIFWNQAAERILKYTAAEATGRYCFEILGGRDEQGRTLCRRFCAIAIRAERGAVLPNTDVHTQTRDGDSRWLNVTSFSYPAGGRPSSRVVVHLFRDVSARKSRERFADRVLAASEQLQQEDPALVITATPVNPPLNRLSGREREVLLLLAQGLGTAEVAGALTLSPATVRNHVQNILSKLGVHSRVEAVAHAYQQGLIETGSARSSPPPPAPPPSEPD